MKTLNITVANSQMGKLDLLQKETGMTRSDIIRRAVDEYFDNHFLDRAKEGLRELLDGDNATLE